MRVNLNFCRKFSDSIKTLSLRELDSYTDPRFYPQPDVSKESVVRYFLVMVAMDHRLSRPWRKYRGVVDGKYYSGADLLYRLGKKKFESEPMFFSPEYLCNVTKEDIISWLRVEEPENIEPPDPEVRAMLLRDLGNKIIRLYDSKALNILKLSDGVLKNNRACGFIDLLKVFKAYIDPVEKKAYLLAKFLEGRGIIKFKDPENKEVPVDNHLVRIAIRIGIVDLPDFLLYKIKSFEELSSIEDILIRLYVRESYKLVAKLSDIDPFVLDDFLWNFGKRCCTKEDPICMTGCREGCNEINGCRGAKCIFEDFCRAANERSFMVKDYNYYDTWYY